jgi:maleate cis-trans isomerase
MEIVRYAKIFAALGCIGFGVSGCSSATFQKDLASITGAANAVAPIVKSIGADVVAIECSSASLVSVVAKDAGAAARVQKALAANAKVATDACPLLTGSPAVVVKASS